MLFLRIPMGGGHRAQMVEILDLFHGLREGEGWTADQQYGQKEEQERRHIAAQAALGGETEALHGRSPPLTMGNSTRKVWPNTSPSSHRCSASSGGSWGRMIQRLTPELREVAGMYSQPVSVTKR